MESFFPVQSDGPLRPLCFHFGDLPQGVASQARPQRRVDSLATQAAYWAGHHATGCKTKYEMDNRFGTPHDEPVKMSQSSDRKNRVWESWAAGCLPIPKLLANNDPRLHHRLACIRAKTDEVDRVLAMALWRNLVPKPLTVEELDIGRCLDLWLINWWGDWPLPERKLTLRFLDQLWHSLQVQYGRHCAIDALWMVIRSSYHWLDIAQYGLSYMIWRGSRRFIAEDPVFGKIAADLYQHTEQYFSRVQLTNEKCFDKAVKRLEGAALTPIVDHEAKTVLVPLNQIVPVLKLAREASAPGDDPA